ncbi:MAG TPA: LysR family transcriptional regulator [Myxococcota bacterium]|nr:LysR family transcriptional regulator [Myxococcota bacterium]
MERLFLDPKDLQIFVRAADLQSLSAAAVALRVPKSTASRSLQRLEERVGAPLLRRTNRRLVLTETGTLLHRHALRILGELEQAETAVSRVSGAPRGLLRVTAPLTFGRAFVAPLVPDFLEAHPQIQMALDLTPGGVDLFRSDADVAVRVGPIEDSSLRARKLGSPDVWLCASPGYLQRRGVPKQLADLAAHDLLDWSPPHGDGEWTLIGPEGVEKLGFTPRLTVNDSSVLRVAAIAGTGVGWIPAFLCEADVRSGRLRRVLPEWQREPFEIYALFPGGRALSPKVRAFVEFLVDRLRVHAVDPDGAAAHGLDDGVG